MSRIIRKMIFLRRKVVLILMSVLLLVVFLVDGVRISSTLIKMKSAIRNTAHFAVSGQPFVEGMDVSGNRILIGWTYPKSERMIAIQNKTVEELGSHGYSKLVFDTPDKDEYDYYAREQKTCYDCKGILGVSIAGQNTNCDFIVGDPGETGFELKLTMYHNLPIWNPIYRLFVSNGFARVQDSVVFRNEGIGGWIPCLLD